VHPSDLVCERKVFFHLASPELGDPYSWRELAWLGEIGKALHNHFLPQFAEILREEGYEVNVEMEVRGWIAGMFIRGIADIVAFKDGQPIVFDLKFLHPAAIHSEPHLHHRRQICVYAFLLNADRAMLVYCDRTNPNNVVLHEFNYQQILDTINEEVKPFLERVRTALEAQSPDLLPIFSPRNYPCLFRTREGTAFCPFYATCHGEPAPLSPPQQTLAEPFREIVANYIETINTIKAVEAELKPLREHAEMLKSQLEQLLTPNQPLTFGNYRVTLKQVTQQRLDTNAARELLAEHNLPVPIKEVTVTSIFVQEVNNGE